MCIGRTRNGARNTLTSLSLVHYVLYYYPLLSCVAVVVFLLSFLFSVRYFFSTSFLSISYSEPRFCCRSRCCALVAIIAVLTYFSFFFFIHCLSPQHCPSSHGDLQLNTFLFLSHSTLITLPIILFLLFFFHVLFRRVSAGRSVCVCVCVCAIVSVCLSTCECAAESRSTVIKAGETGCVKEQLLFSFFFLCFLM